MNEQPLSAYVIANTVGMLVSYRGSRSWAFRHREAVGTAGGRVSYFVINTLSMGIPLVCLAISRYVLDLDSGLADNISANVIGLASAPPPGSGRSASSCSCGRRRPAPAKWPPDLRRALR